MIDREWRNRYEQAHYFWVTRVIAASGLFFAFGCGTPASFGTAKAASADSGVGGGGRLLGHIEFPNSGAKAAQRAFIDGVLYLHNFEYADARTSFQKAEEIDSEFALAYWGESMTHNHPIWMQQDRDAAIAALQKLAPTPEEQLAKAPTEREREYLRTAHVLFGLTDATKDMDKETRDDQYRAAMAGLAEAYPADNEARSLYALSILGTAHEGRDFRTYMQAAAVASEVWRQNDQHPGAAHYLIHSFDDPIHAPLGLPMAKTYARIAPEAAHAQHMVSHIFVALGQWADVAKANEAARNVQTARQRRLGERESVCSHYPYWLQYAYLQQSRFEDAREVLANCEARVRDDPKPGDLWHYAVMRGRQILDSPSPSGDVDSSSQPPDLLVDIEPGTSGYSDHLFVSAYQAALAGDVAKARTAIKGLERSSSRGDRQVTEVQALQIKGLVKIATGDTRGGLLILQKAAEQEESMPYSFGPPAVLKPSWELLGEQQLLANEPATAAFRSQLLRTPRRVQALTGLATALLREGKAEEAKRVQDELAAIAVG